MKNLTIQQQALLFQGKDKWHTNTIEDTEFKQLSMHDGPNGLRIEVNDALGFDRSKPAISYPCSALLACSFDPQLLHAFGNVLAEECIQEGVDILLGPGINHKRSPKGGRNFEYFSEDPILSGELAASYIQGVQEKGIGTSLKHYACNSREYGRTVSDSIIDERTMHELYLKQFQLAIQKAHPFTIMNAYNKVNGIHCTEHKQLMDEARKWGFDGVFVSDWGGVYHPVDSLKAGMNLEMPGGNIGADKLIVEAIQSKQLDANILHQSTNYLKQLSKKCHNYIQQNYDKEKHLAFAQQAVEQSAVLLKNEDNILPLNKQQSVLVVGPFSKYTRNSASGSANVNANALDNLYTALKKEAKQVLYADGFSMKHEGSDAYKIAQACNYAKNVDTVIIVCGLPEGYESEGYDRKCMSLPKNQIDCINKLSTINSNIIVILQVGAPVRLPCIQKIKGIVLTYLAGAKSGTATSNILYGKVNPSGKLAETWPIQESDVPCYRYFDNDLYQSQYRETIYSGYRYYDTFDIPVLFPFGHGLSYTQFNYANIHTTIQDQQLITTLTLTNTGNYDGQEIVQIYAALPESKIARSKHTLIHFQKVYLKAHTAKTITIQTPLSNLEYYDVKQKTYCIEQGNYHIHVASSIQSIYSDKTIFIQGNAQPYSTIHKDMYHIQNGILTITDKDYESILGHVLTKKHEVKPYTPDSTLLDLCNTKLGKIIYSIAYQMAKKGFVKGVNLDTVQETTIRQILWLDKMTWQTVYAIVQYLNHPKISSFSHILQQLRKK